jgi:tetratricopeptide (TPR) repeat protein
LDDSTRDFLTVKAGWISPRNDKFLSLVYLSAVTDTLGVLLGAELEANERAWQLSRIAANEKTARLRELPYAAEIGVEEKLITPIARWLPATAERALLEALLRKDYAGALGLLGVFEERPGQVRMEISLNRILNPGDADMLPVLLEARRKFTDLQRAQIGFDGWVREILERNPLLAGLSVELAAQLPRAAALVLRQEYARALDALVAASDEIELAEEDAEGYLLFAVNLAAAAEDAEAYIYFRKVFVSFLIDAERRKDAAKELNELLEMLPEDGELMELRGRLV